MSLAPDNLLVINQYKYKNMKSYLTLKYNKLKECGRSFIIFPKKKKKKS